jgi:uncharacterized protein (DUF1684 family)
MTRTLHRALALALLAAAACSPRPADTDPYQKEIEAWKAHRLARLTSEDGWLALAGLFWLEPGENRVGSGVDNRVVLPRPAPETVGTLHLEGSSVRLDPMPEAGLTIEGKPATSQILKSDQSDGGPTIVKVGTVSFFVHRVGEKLGVRVKDSTSEARKDFKGLEYFPTDPEWRCDARFEPYGPPKTISVPNILGTVDKDTSPGALVFTVGGKEYRLDPVIEAGSDALFVIFADETNGNETYGSGRFLYAPMPKNGRTVVDFNKAYNPPCAFTPYATCPLPPAENRLPVRVTAGEKKYAGGHH